MQNVFAALLRFIAAIATFLAFVVPTLQFLISSTLRFEIGPQSWMCRRKHFQQKHPQRRFFFPPPQAFWVPSRDTPIHPSSVLTIPFKLRTDAPSTASPTASRHPRLPSTVCAADEIRPHLCCRGILSHLWPPHRLEPSPPNFRLISYLPIPMCETDKKKI